MAEKSAYLDLTIISAADLKRNWLSGDQTTAVAWVDPSEKRTTSIVGSNRSNVQWPHEKLILSLHNGLDNVSQGKLLTIEIHARGTLGDSLLGSVYVPLIELASNGEKSRNTILMYQIVKPSGKRQGSMKFFAKVVQPRVSVLASAVTTPFEPPIPLLEDDPNFFGSNVVYPPPSHAIGDVEINDERPASEANSPYPYPPPPHFAQNYTDRHDSWQLNVLPDPSYGIGSTYSPHVHPPLNMIYPSHTSPSPCRPYSNYTSNTPYPPSPLALGTPYPPPTSVYPPPTTFTDAPYPPIAPNPQLPQIIPQHPSQMYSPAPFYGYSNFSGPLYTPSYGQQPATVHYH